MVKTVEEGFQKFLENVVPLLSERRKGVSHRASVKSSLKKSLGCTGLLEMGSFGNQTGVKHYSDTDYFAVCPLESLRGNSSTVLRRVRQALQYTFHRTAGRIKVNSPAVTVGFGHFASENLEITPCYFDQMITTPLGKKRAYGIPDGSGGWMLSSPAAHNQYVETHNRRLQGKLKPLIRLVKAWKFYLNVPISSFYLELRITKLLENKGKINYESDLYGITKKLFDNGLADIRDPMEVSGIISACRSAEKKRAALSKLATAYSRAGQSYKWRNDDLDECFSWWKKFYNGKFPSR